MLATDYSTRLRLVACTLWAVHTHQMTNLLNGYLALFTDWKSRYVERTMDPEITAVSETKVVRHRRVHSLFVRGFLQLCLT